MNYLNSSLVDSKIRVGVGANPKSRSKEPRIVKLSILRILLLYTIAPIKVESLSNLSKIL